MTRIDQNDLRNSLIQMYMMQYYGKMFPQQMNGPVKIIGHQIPVCLIDKKDLFEVEEDEGNTL
jgi:hypothetical protein